jgi:hypothetical protein
MEVKSLNKLKEIPNLLLISGNGRNVGKTTLACQVISFFSGSTEVTGLKISPHFHPVNEADIILKNDKFTIAEEKQISSKDSSLMLQAGAKKVYFVMVKPENLKDSILQLIEMLPEHLIICESGGLVEHVTPGLFLMVRREKEKIIKQHLLKYSPVIVNNDGKKFDFNIHQLMFNGQKIGLIGNHGKI